MRFSLSVIENVSSLVCMLKKGTSVKKLPFLEIESLLFNKGY